MNQTDTIIFTTNWNGKLFLDCFGTVRLHNPGKYAVGKKMNIMYNKIPMGIAKIEALRVFQYKQISDALSYIDVGKPAVYLSQLLSNMYTKKGLLFPSSELDHVILVYEERNIESHQMVWREWWDDKQQQLKLF